MTMNLFKFAQNGKEATAVCLKILKESHVELLAESDHGGYFRFKNKIYSVWDNGGEIGVQLVNIDESKFIATDRNVKTTAEEVASNIYLVMTGQPIDYQFEYGDCVLNEKMF